MLRHSTTTSTKKIAVALFVLSVMALTVSLTPSTVHAQEFSEYSNLVSTLYHLSNGTAPDGTLPGDIFQKTKTNWDSWNSEERAAEITRLQQELTAAAGTLTPEDFSVIFTPPERLRIGRDEATPTDILAGDRGSEDLKPSTQDCTIWNFEFYRCLWDPLIASIGSIPASIGAVSVTLAGMLFNYLVQHTIIDFKTSVIDAIGDGINTAWTAFRDIANIVIIGMFTFIAISLILGIKEYGERKMIARVLIVAVLINFSLLFTKMIIDASHFTAYQFYKAAQAQTPEFQTKAASGAAVTTQQQGKVDQGIAGAFLNAMGITGIGDVYNAVLRLQSGDSGTWWVTILYGLFTGILFALAAIVLLYGAFLLIARALLLIFLMVTSPLAFASWLVPKFAQDGWHKWWDTLLRLAVFAPLLMILLWVTLMVANAFKGKAVGTLGKLSDPGTPAEFSLGIDALFGYLVILGMLFLSIKIASKFSGTIAGFAVAGSALKLSAGVPLALGARVAGFAGRNIIGRRAAMSEKETEKDIGKYRTLLAKVRPSDTRRKGILTEKLDELEKSKKSAGGLANRQFRLGGTALGGAVFQGLGVPGGVVGGKVAGFTDRAKRIAGDAAKRAVEVTTLSEAQKTLIKNQAEGQARAQHFQERQSKEEAARTKQREKEAAEEKARTKSDEHNAAETARKELQQTIKQLEDAGVQGTPDNHPMRRQYAEAQIDLAGRDADIERLKTELQAIERETVTQTKSWQDAVEALKEHNSMEKRVVNRAGEEALTQATANLQEAAKTIATNIASRRGTRMVPLGTDPDNSYISNLAREMVTPRIKNAALRERIKTEAEMRKDDPSLAEGAAPSSPSGPSPNTSGGATSGQRQ